MSDARQCWWCRCRLRLADRLTSAMRSCGCDDRSLAITFLRAETHAQDCDYLNAAPMTGDEASLCSCGAVELAEEKYRAAVRARSSR